MESPSRVSPIELNSREGVESPRDVDEVTDIESLADYTARVGEALDRVGLTQRDVTAQLIIQEAALLNSTDPKSPYGPISTIRLFLAIIAASRFATASPPHDIDQGITNLAAAIENDPAHRDKLRRFEASHSRRDFRTAQRQIEVGLFSDNTLAVLRQAAKDGVLRGREIARALMTWSDGTLRDIWPDLSDLTSVLDLAGPTPPDVASPPTAMSQIEAVLSARNIPVLDVVKSLLLRATAFSGSGFLEIEHLVYAFLSVDLPAELQLHPTDPSAMFRESAPIMPAPTAGLLAGQTFNPSSALSLGTSIESLLQRALNTQQQIFLNPRLGTKGLVAALLTTPPAEVPERLFIPTAPNTPPTPEGGVTAIAQRFREIVRDRLADMPDEVQQWNRALELEPASFPKLSADQPSFSRPQDKLGITNDALAIANVAAGQDTSLPLAFGIFGDWGAGKTFFMRLVQEQIAGLVSSSARDDGFEHAIVQIQFNAWHYAETNLWASLVGHIFDELDRWMTRNEGPTDSDTADQLLRRLSTSRQLTLEAVTELVQRRKEHDSAAQAFAVAEQDLVQAKEDAALASGPIWRAVIDTAHSEIVKDDELKQQLESFEVTLGVPQLLQSKARMTAALDDLNRSTSSANVALGAMRSTIGNGRTVLLAIVALVSVPLLLLLLHQGLAWAMGYPQSAEIGRGFEALAGLLAMISVLVRRITGNAKSLSDKFARLRKSIDAEITKATLAEQVEAVDAAAKVAHSAAQVEKAKTLLQATGDAVVAAQKDYAEETGSLRIRRFVRARAGADGYGKHLGLVSTIRKDFEQLASLMLKPETPPPDLELARKHYETRINALIGDAGNALKPEEQTRLRQTTESIRSLAMPEAMAFHRIVLYIDDLDRCEPNKVVEVLQAVNMLLSFQLFVVLVAVDARWLSRSLAKQYPDFFGSPEAANNAGISGGSGANAGRNGNERHIERATPADYLEKVFQIPYWIPPMTSSKSADLVGDLVAADRVLEPAEHRSPAAAPPVMAGPLPVAVVQSREDDQPQSMKAPSRALGLTKDEVVTLTALSPFIGTSPRRARRFVNVYRVAKASLTPGDVKKLEDGEHRALATQLAIATGAPNAFALWAAACGDSDEGSIAARVRAFATNEEERRNIDGAFAKFCAMPGEGAHPLRMLANQAARASRFSFAVPQKSVQPAMASADRNPATS
jgi:hypothetical protein